MDQESPRKQPPEPPADGAKPRPGFPGLGLALAFLPSAMLLLMWAVLSSNPPSNPPAGLFIFCCLISIICCFAASFLLFRRGTGLAILGGILFILLNAFVSFLFGCGAMLTGMHF